MSRKILAAIAATVLGALTVLGIAAATPGTAHASTDPGVCADGLRLLDYYDSIGDIATGDGLELNLISMGCIEE